MVAPANKRFLLESDKAAANGLATLDGTGKIPDGQIPTAVKKGELVYNVKDHGNPAVDFAAAVRAAITACQAGGGGDVFIPGKALPYVFSDAGVIDVPAGVNIRGAGAGSVTIAQANWNGEAIFRFSGSFGAAVNATANIPSNSRVIPLVSTAGMAAGDLLLLGSDETPAGGAAGTDGYRSEYVRIRSVDSGTQITIWGRTTQAYASASSAGVKSAKNFLAAPTLSGITFVNPEPDLHFNSFVMFYQCTDITVRDVIARGCDSTGVRLINVYGFNLSNIHFYDQPDRVDVDPKRFGYGIATYAAVEQGSVTNCHFTRLRHGFTTSAFQGAWGQSRNITVTGCTGKENTNAVFDTHAGAVNIAFNGCTVTNTTSAAFQLRGLGNSVTSCTVDGAAYGVFVTAGAYGAKIKNNTFRNIGGWTTGGGTQAEYPADVAGGGYGIVVNGTTNATISGNDFDNLTRAGVFIGGQGSTAPSRIYITDNKFANLGKSGASRAAVWINNDVTSIGEFYFMKNLAVAYAAASAEPDSAGAIDDLITIAPAAAAVTGAFNVIGNTVYGMGFSLVGGAGSSATKIYKASNEILGVTAPTVDPAILTASNQNKLAIDLLQAKALMYPWLVGDSFVRANAASLGTADTGQAWTADAGAFQIVSKAATPTTTTNTRSTLDTGTVDHMVSVRIDSAPNAAQHWLAARFVDGSNFYRFGFDGGNFALQKVVAGSVTVLATLSGITNNIPGTTIGLKCKGTALTVYVNNVQVGAVTDSALSTGTKAGLQANNVAAVFRSFTVQAV
jgi:hypothetical protein